MHIGTIIAGSGGRMRRRSKLVLIRSNIFGAGIRSIKCTDVFLIIINNAKMFA